MNDKYEVLRRLHQAEGNLSYTLSVFGDYLSEKYGYKDLYNMDAIYFHIVKTHNWLPRDVRSMTPEDLRLILSQEMAGWTLPAEAR